MVCTLCWCGVNVAANHHFTLNIILMKAIGTPEEDPEKIKQVLKNHPDCIPIRFLHDSQSKLKKADNELYKMGCMLVFCTDGNCR